MHRYAKHTRHLSRFRSLQPPKGDPVKDENQFAEPINRMTYFSNFNSSLHFAHV